MCFVYIGPVLLIIKIASLRSSVLLLGYDSKPCRGCTHWGTHLMFLCICFQDVVGWYKFRRHSDQVMTFRERLLHRNLQKHLSSQELVFLLLTPSIITESCSTHRLEHALYKPQKGWVLTSCWLSSTNRKVYLTFLLCFLLTIFVTVTLFSLS